VVVAAVAEVEPTNQLSKWLRLEHQTKVMAEQMEFKIIEAEVAAEPVLLAMF
jgi:hypothetical protein